MSGVPAKIVDFSPDAHTRFTCRVHARCMKLIPSALLIIPIGSFLPSIGSERAVCRPTRRQTKEQPWITSHDHESISRR
jgi:hypothetical protein